MLEKHKAEINRLSKEKSTEVKRLQEAVQSAKQASAKAKEELALKVDGRKTKAKIVEKER